MCDVLDNINDEATIERVKAKVLIPAPRFPGLRVSACVAEWPDGAASVALLMRHNVTPPEYIRRRCRLNFSPPPVPTLCYPLLPAQTVSSSQTIASKREGIMALHSTRAGAWGYFTYFLATVFFCPSERLAKASWANAGNHRSSAGRGFSVFSVVRSLRLA